MKISEVMRLVDAKIVCGTVGAEDEVTSAFGADLMSDMLAFVNEGTLILTGMINPHVLRTAEMLDVRFILFVRGKQPTQEMIGMANELDITLLATECTLFTASGILYGGGLLGCKRNRA